MKLRIQNIMINLSQTKRHHTTKNYILINVIFVTIDQLKDKYH